MRVLGSLCAFALFLLMIAAPAAYPQDDNKPQDAPKAQDDKAAKPQDDKAAKQDDKAKQDEKAQQKEQKDQAKQEKKAQQDQDRNARDQERDQRPVDNRQMENHPADNRQMATDQNHPAADRGRRIPDDQFRSHFGREHTFHVQRTEVVNVSQPTVVYGGYSFQLVEAWPVGWGFDDDCYIDYVDGEYFLFDLLHPGIRVAVFVIG